MSGKLSHTQANCCVGVNKNAQACFFVWFLIGLCGARNVLISERIYVCFVYICRPYFAVASECCGTQRQIACRSEAIDMLWYSTWCWCIYGCVNKLCAPFRIDPLRRCVFPHANEIVEGIFSKCIFHVFIYTKKYSSNKPTINVAANVTPNLHRANSRTIKLRRHAIYVDNVVLCMVSG